MSPEQEEALYDFLTDRIEPFTIKQVASAVYKKDRRRFGRLSTDIAGLIKTQRLAFEVGANKWITRRGCFSDARFVICPTRVELLNGILIPGHRCAPLANPGLLPHEYVFYWNGEPIPFTSTEADPEELYPYYSIFGEEFAPQYIAQESPDNEKAFNADPYEDPAEVSIKTVDMRRFYRETGFVPGDRIVASVKDWQNGRFDLERAAGDSWSEADLDEWLCAAEEGFKKSFEAVGADGTTEEQAAWAYFCGGERMRDVPCYPLEDFLYKKTDKIEVVQFGIESRFWYAGKDIPDYRELRGIHTQCDETPLETMLFQNGVPVSEFVAQAYVRDALYRNDSDIAEIVQRIVPPSIKMSRWDLEMLASYVFETMEEFEETYLIFSDKDAGPVRQRVAELHTAVIDLSARLKKGGIDSRWLPKHSFIILSQIQQHAAVILENLDANDDPFGNELGAMDNSLESMCETFAEVKEMIDKSLDNYRRSNITLVKFDSVVDADWRSIQISIGGTDVWRRLVLPCSVTLAELHNLIQALFGWKGIYNHFFIVDAKEKHYKWIDEHNNVKESIELATLFGENVAEFMYEYGTHWTVKIIVLSVCVAAQNGKAHCTMGENAAPPEKVEGPLRFRRFISALDSANAKERKTAKEQLGAAFDLNEFNLQKCNNQIKGVVEAFGQR
ncbi:MAG: plasmid pRiA4b ORF-3 family protein [Spirochaetaceae bacterium]|nr:plasmid pRiA4b ORF-3 family protein [Spirochaetaceae bacterium]